MKAKFISKYYGRNYDKDYIFYEYEYRGRRYEVYVNTAKGNEPLVWQHKSAQARIDAEIEIEEKRSQNKEQLETAEDSLDYFFKMLDEI